MTIYALSSSKSPEALRYIGLTTKPPKKRLIEHISESSYLRTRKDKWIKSELNQGNNILIETIDSAQTIPELKKKEIEYIKLIKSCGAKLVNGTNGGDGTFGIKQSEYQRRKNGEAKSKRVFVFDIKTKEFICEYRSVTNMIQENKFSRSQVGKVLSGKSSNHKGRVFSYTKDFPPPFIGKGYFAWNKGISTKGKQRFKTAKVEIETDGAIMEFDTVGELARYLNIRHSQICVSIKSRGGRYRKHFIQYVK